MIIQDNLYYLHPFNNRSWPMRWNEVYSALGLNPKRHLPAEGVWPPKFIGNIRVWVKPKVPGKRQIAGRVMCECHICGKILNVGRFQQHYRRMHTLRCDMGGNQ